MVDTVDVRNVKSTGLKRVLRIQNRSDGTGEAAATKLDISTLTTVAGAVCTYTVIDRIEYDIVGMQVRLDWDHTTDDEIVTLQGGTGSLDWTSIGGLVDPKSAGGTGDILLNTAGHTAGDSYDITIYYRCKA